MMKKVVVGNIYQNEIEGQLFTMHYVLMHPQFGPYVRIYRGPDIDVNCLLIDKVGLGIMPAISKGGWKYSGFQSPGSVTLGPALYFEAPYPGDWFFVDGEKFKRLGKTVPPKFQNLEVLGTNNYFVLAKRLATGQNDYSYEKWMEYKLKYAK